MEEHTDSLSDTFAQHGGQRPVPQNELETVAGLTIAISNLYWSSSYPKMSVPEDELQNARETVYHTLTKFAQDLEYWRAPGALTGIHSPGRLCCTAALGCYTLKDAPALSELAERSRADELADNDFDTLNALAKLLLEGVHSELDEPTSAFT